jgi:hypothetical protein
MSRNWRRYAISEPKMLRGAPAADWGGRDDSIWINIPLPSGLETVLKKIGYMENDIR